MKDKKEVEAEKEREKESLKRSDFSNEGKEGFGRSESREESYDREREEKRF